MLNEMFDRMLKVMNTLLLGIIVSMRDKNVLLLANSKIRDFTLLTQRTLILLENRKHLHLLLI